ncbi:MAG: ribonuclease HIII [Candidatus Aenigmatarchaeota archaeon]
MQSKIGVDESGKGDYFGYLVVAGVYVNKKIEEKLRSMNVRDSKLISDNIVLELSKEIKKICPYEILKISPEKYNNLYKKFRNLNKLLAWGHARVIENLLEKTRPDIVITDKFADEKFLRNALFKRGRSIKIIQKIKAESDIAVAAASILARAEFLKTLKKLSIDLGYKLPKGATHVEYAAKYILKKFGKDTLYQVAKAHFKISKKIFEKLND